MRVPEDRRQREDRLRSRRVLVVEVVVGDAAVQDERAPVPLVDARVSRVGVAEQATVGNRAGDRSQTAGGSDLAVDPEAAPREHRRIIHIPRGASPRRASAEAAARSPAEPHRQGPASAARADATAAARAQALEEGLVGEADQNHSSPGSEALDDGVTAAALPRGRGHGGSARSRSSRYGRAARHASAQVEPPARAPLPRGTRRTRSRSGERLGDRSRPRRSSGAEPVARARPRLHRLDSCYSAPAGGFFFGGVCSPRLQARERTRSLSMGEPASGSRAPRRRCRGSS